MQSVVEKTVNLRYEETQKLIIVAKYVNPMRSVIERRSVVFPSK